MQDGVHIGQSDMEMKNARELLGAEKIIGVTAKTVEQARAAEASGADYLGSGGSFWDKHEGRCKADGTLPVPGDL